VGRGGFAAISDASIVIILIITTDGTTPTVCRSLSTTVSSYKNEKNQNNDVNDEGDRWIIAVTVLVGRQQL